MEGREVNIDSPRKNPPNSTTVQSRVNERASSNLQIHQNSHRLFPQPDKEHTVSLYSCILRSFRSFRTRYTLKCEAPVCKNK